MPNTIAESLQRLVNARTAISDAITAKGGTVTSGDGFEEFPADIATIPSGGGGGADAGKPVRFIDYDGTIVDSYTAAEFAELSSMPNNPSHEGLTAQGWNWSLADAKAYVAKYGRLNIGQMYITSDGKTRIKIKLEDGRLSPVLGLGIDGSVDVDWGDDTAHGEMTGSNVSTLVQLQHVYAAAGEYTIVLTVTGEMSLLEGLFTKFGAVGNESQAYLSSIKKIHIGINMHTLKSAAANLFSLSSITIPNSVTSMHYYALRGCLSLRSITIPNSISSIGQLTFQGCYSIYDVTLPKSVTSIVSYSFQQCTSLKSIAIPDNMAIISNHMFNNCSSLSSVIIPDSVTSIEDSVFNNCSSLSSVIIPDSVTSIGSGAFNNCSSLGYIKFMGDTPPTAGNSLTFSGIPTDCIIYVPEGSLEDYEDETNYPDPDVYTYIEY